MNRKLGITNFRVFNENGVQFKIAPITVLTGCNSSGKSSVIKSMMLFENFLNGYINDYIKYTNDYIVKEKHSKVAYTLDLNEGEHNLARFNKTLNKYSNSDEMTFSWSKHSIFANKEIDVEFVFKKNEKNVLGNGLLHTVSLKCEGNSIYTIHYDVDKGEISSSIDLIFLKKMFFQFAAVLPAKETLPDYKHKTSENSFYILLSNVAGKSNSIINNSLYRYLKELTIERRDDIKSGFLYNLILKEIKCKNKVLFHTPSYDYLENATKESINELVFDLIEKDDENQRLLLYLEELISQFKNSNHKYFKDYFNEMEDEFLSEKFSNQEVLNGYFSSKLNSRTNNISAQLAKEIKDIIDPDFEEPSSSDFNFKTLYAIMYIYSTYLPLNYGEFSLDNEIKRVDVDEYVTWAQYIDIFVKDAILTPPSFFKNVDFINSNRPKVERFYDLSNLSSDFGFLIKDYVTLDKKDIPLKNGVKYKLGDFLRKWVREFEIADDVYFETTKEGSGIYIYLENNGEQTLLADLGYGVTQVLSMLLKIEMSIFKSFELSSFDKIVYGIRYSETKYYDSFEQTLTIEEPEANLHPMLQSKLANMFMEVNELYNINFILETHSEYLIRMFQVLVGNPDHSARAEDIIIYYLYHPDKIPEGKEQILDLEMRKDGLLRNDFGSGFFDEASQRAFELLKFKS